MRWGFYVLLAVLTVLRSSGVVAAAPVLVLCETTKGPVRMHVYPEWAPLGVERFLDLVRTGFFTQVGLTRVVQGFLVQFGIAADPRVQQQWNARSNIQDDPMIGTHVKRGTLAYAGSGKNSRGTQIWIAFQDSTSLGTQPWETPFGQVVEEDMQVVDSWYSGYGDMAAFGGHGPDQGLQQQQGNAYLKQFPLLDYITSCAIQDEPAPAAGASTAQDAPRYKPHGQLPHSAVGRCRGVLRTPITRVVTIFMGRSWRRRRVLACTTRKAAPPILMWRTSSRVQTTSQ